MSHNLSIKKSDMMDMKSNWSTGNVAKSSVSQVPKSSSDLGIDSSSEKQKEVITIFTPEFRKVLLSDTNTLNASDGASTKYSQDKKIVIYNSVQEEAHNIIVRNNSNNEIFKIELINGSDNYNISYWDIYDDNNLILSFSNKNNNEHFDNKIYLLNTESLGVKVIYQTGNEMQELSSIQKEGNNLKLTIKNYNSVDKKSYSTETKIINIAK
jgi:hypothetical protein